MQKTIAVFGSTGSIGKNAIKIIKQNPDLFKVKVLTANSNVKELAEQVIQVQPEYVAISDKSKIAELKSLLKHNSVIVLEEDLSEIAKIKVDLSLMAVVGHYAILPTINAIKTGNNIALANKECLVCAGNLINNLAQIHNVKIIPIDSEHSGLFQIFEFERTNLIKDVTLTASGGPFREYSLDQMKNVTVKEALKHPNWAMGPKITIDSATLVNKCLEVIEAYHLFPLDPRQIKIIIHPESIIHAILNFCDGSILAQASIPNMQIPISYSLFYPNRAVLTDFNTFNFAKISRLNFAEPDYDKFKSLKLLNAILGTVDTNSSLIFNIVNEVAVEAFLKGKISFLQIVDIIEEVLQRSIISEIKDYDDLVYQIERVKLMTRDLISIF